MDIIKYFQHAKLIAERVRVPWRVDSSQIQGYKSFGDKQIKYVCEGTCLKCLSPLRKSSASLGKECKVKNAWK